MSGIKEYINHLLHDSSLNIGDISMGGITVATIVQILPTASAVLSMVWVSLRIWVTVRDDILKKKKE